MVTDSRVAFEHLASIREPTEALNKVALATILEAVCPTLLYSTRRCLHIHHAADTLTKNNCSAALHLLKVLRDGA